jgi:hypothetical protein
MNTDEAGNSFCFLSVLIGMHLWSIILSASSLRLGVSAVQILLQ